MSGNTYNYCVTFEAVAYYQVEVQVPEEYRDNEDYIFNLARYAEEPDAIYDWDADPVSYCEE